MDIPEGAMVHGKILPEQEKTVREEASERSCCVLSVTPAGEGKVVVSMFVLAFHYPNLF